MPESTAPDSAAPGDSLAPSNVEGGITPLPPVESRAQEETESPAESPALEGEADLSSSETGEAVLAQEALPEPAAAPPTSPSLEESPASPPISESQSPATVTEEPLPSAEVPSVSPEVATAPSETASPMPELEELVVPLEPESKTAVGPLSVDIVITTPEEKSYRIISLLKSDAQFNLYEAVSDDEDQPVWVLESLTEAGSARLKHETEVLEGLECRMFPRILSGFQSGERTILITEPLASAPTFAALLSAEEPPFGPTLTALAQVAYALSRLHRHGWVHLGLRPSALVLSKPVKVLDLSYATRIGEAPPAPFYHAGYSPPELLTGEPVDARADVYAVGALLFHAINGQPIGETGVELSMWEPPHPIGGIPQILHRCLGDPDTRYATMEELHRDLLTLARRMIPRVSYSLGASSNIGLEPSRTANEDAYGFLSGQMESDAGPDAWAAMLVADGMGGMAAGEVASEVAIKTALAEAAATFGPKRALSTEDQVAAVKRWMIAANGNVCEVMDQQRARGGCTLICACIVGKRLAIAHVGDCRLYHLRGDAITLVTRDHSLVMALVQQGELTLEQARHHPDRNKVTRSLGDRQPLPEYFIDTLEQATGAVTMELQPGDLLLGCTDGLWEPVEEAKMQEALRQHPNDLNAAAQVMTEIALQNGAPDNATVVLLRLNEN